MPDQDFVPVARSPIPTEDPFELVGGWEVSRRRSSAPLRIVDCAPTAKVLVRARPGGEVAAALGVPFGRAARDESATLVVGSGPGEWTLLSAPGSAAEVIARILALPDDALVSAVDITHGRALMRLTGTDAPRLLSKLCAIDFDDAVTPQGSAFRSSVAKVATDVVRDDHNGTRSYLLHCERSSGQYLFEALLDAGSEFGAERDGWTSAAP